MKINRIHSLTLKGVVIDPKPSDCFMHDLDFLGVTVDDVRDELEGQRMYVYNGDFTANVRMYTCPWCKERFDGELEKHIYQKHNKTIVNLKMYKFQIELYKERLVLLRAGLVDHTYFVYMNQPCQFCDFERARGRGLCSIPESARNKTRSLVYFGFSAINFPQSFMKKANIGYIIGRPI